MIHIDPNREIIGPMMAGMQQNSDTVSGAVQSMAVAAQSMSDATQAMLAIANSMQALSGSMHDAISVIGAPTELIRDKKTGRAIGSQKVLQLVRNT